jgi:hypothetical protein
MAVLRDSPRMTSLSPDSYAENLEKGDCSNNFHIFGKFFSVFEQLFRL